MAEILYGNKVAQALRAEIKKEISEFFKKTSKKPLLASVVVGGDPALNSYIRAQGEVAAEVGIGHRLVSLPESSSRSAISDKLKELNSDKRVNAIFISTPLPEGINMKEVSGLISAEKDAEGVHPENLGRVLLGDPIVAPCTAVACIKILEAYNIKMHGRDAVVVGHSDIVGKPLALMLLNRFVTTTVCHIATFEADRLEWHVRRADILFSAVGKAALIKGEWIKEGAVVIDVGINKSGKKLYGDVEFEKAKLKASYITPVPGGIGPLTVTMLMKNCLELFKKQLTG